MARFTLRHPIWTLSLCLVLGAFAASRATQLRFDTNFTGLLPDDARVVAELERAEKLAGGTVELIIAVANIAPGPDARLAFSQQLVSALRKEPWVYRADVEYPVAFFKSRRLWLLKHSELDKLASTVEKAAEALRLEANPLYVALDDTAAEALEEVRSQLRGSMHSEDWPKLEQQIYTEDGRYLLLRVKPGGNAHHMQEGARLLARVQTLIDRLQPKQAGVAVRLTGSLPVNQEQHALMTRDLGLASLLALVGILLLLSLVTRRLSATLVIAPPLLLGIVLTLGLTQVWLGQLNLVSGFLVTALLGVGVDFGIHLYLAYLSELAQGRSQLGAMRRAQRLTFPGCLTAALTSTAAFLAMASSDFRGFREYGQIAALGVLLTLTATFVLMPPLAMALTRRGGMAPAGFALRWMKLRAFAPVTVGAALLLSLLFGSAALKLRYHNDFKALTGYSPAVRFAAYVERSFSGSLAPAAIAVPTIQDARRVESLARTHMHGPEAPFLRVVSLASLIPARIGDKTPLFEDMRRALAQLPRAALSKEEAHDIEHFEALLAQAPWDLEAIPRTFRRLFESVGGERNFVVIWPRGRMAEDQEIADWAAALDAVKASAAEAGIDALILDENRLAARVLAQIRRDGPRVLGLAALAILLILLVDLRQPRDVLLVSAHLALGLLWTLGLLHLVDFELNVFNIALLPTIIGLGIDNGVHIVHRLRRQRTRTLSLGSTGPAALLASLTTCLGFGATLLAHHRGIQSMGALALVGISATLLVTVFVLPASWQLSRGKALGPDAKPRQGPDRVEPT